MNKTIYERIKELSFEEMVQLIVDIHNDCTPPDWVCSGECKECLVNYLESTAKEKITYIFVLPNEEIRNSFHITLNKRLFGNTVEEASKEFQKLYPHVKKALVLRKEYEKASDGTAVYDSVYIVD